MLEAGGSGATLAVVGAGGRGGSLGCEGEGSACVCLCASKMAAGHFEDNPPPPIGMLRPVAGIRAN